MTTVAVTGGHRPVGKALLERLDADRRVERILALDLTDPQMPVAKLERRPCDLRNRVLPAVLEGTDVLVHAGLGLEASHDEPDLFARNVHGTRNLLDAAGKVGVGRVVHLSSVGAYGAHADNPVPLTEEAPLRANADYAPAYHALLAEEVLADFAEAHPGTRVVVLRSATPVGHRADTPITQHLEGPRIVWIRGSEAPLQFVHVDDLAAALHQAVTGTLDGVYNVATDGWLTSEELSVVLGKRRVRVPEALAFSAVHHLWERRIWPSPPGMLHFLMHPTVVSAARLHAAGWAPTRSNREVLREYAAERAGWLRFGPLRFRRRSALLWTTAAGSLAAGTVLRRLRTR